MNEGVEKCQGFGRQQIQVSRKCRGTKHQTQEMRLDRSTRYRGADEIVIRKSLGSLTDS